MGTLVKGFSDILSPVNIATNGEFAINQRETFSSLTKVKQDDIFSDGWRVQNITIDHVEIQNVCSQNLLRVTGHGHKNQYLYLYNFGAGMVCNSLDNYYIETPLTASVNAYVVPASNPVKVAPTPGITSGTSYMYDGALICKPGTLFRPKRLILNAANKSSWIDYGGIRIDLVADGPFDLYLYNFQHLVGNFYNPPLRCPVPRSEDFLRCQRYYQVGTLTEESLGRDNGTHYLKTVPVQFVEMAGTPSVILTATSIFEEGSVTDVANNYVRGSTAVTSRGFSAQAYKAAGGSKPSKIISNWTATIA